MEPNGTSFRLGSVHQLALGLARGGRVSGRGAECRGRRRLVSVVSGLLGMEILPVQANATNTVAIWPGQLTSIAAYRADVRKNLRSALLMGLAGCSVARRARWCCSIRRRRRLCIWCPGCCWARRRLLRSAGRSRAALERLKTARHEHAGAAQVHAPRVLPLFFAAIAVSFYVGYFGAGAGFLFMTLLALFGYEDIHAINALKVVANLLANGIAFVIFIADGQVVWRYCLAAMVAAAIGGYVSASLARRVPQPVLRGLVVVIGLAMAAWFFAKQ